MSWISPSPTAVSYTHLDVYKRQRPEGVNIDQCEQVSRALDPMLDEKEFDDMPSYTPVSYTHLFSASAKEKIEAAGGKAEVI